MRVVVERSFTIPTEQYGSMKIGVSVERSDTDEDLQSEEGLTPEGLIEMADVSARAFLHQELERVIEEGVATQTRKVIKIIETLKD